MRLYLHVQLDSGGSVTVTGEHLTAEDVNEVWTILGGHVVHRSTATLDDADTPKAPGAADLPGPPD